MTQNTLKQQSAKAALDRILPALTPDSVVGVGTGSTANFFIDLLAQHKDAFASTVASSSASADRLRSHGIVVRDLNQVESIEYYIDGADEINPSLMMIKGGGAALTQEKIVAAASTTFICVADQSKWVERLGAFPLPVEVVPMARAYVARALARMGGNPVYRQGCVTDNGCDILDVHGLNIDDPVVTEGHINQIAGVLSNGLFAARKADILLLSTDKGVKTFFAAKA